MAKKKPVDLTQDLQLPDGEQDSPSIEERLEVLEQEAEKETVREFAKQVQIIRIDLPFVEAEARKAAKPGLANDLRVLDNALKQVSLKLKSLMGVEA